MRLVLQRVSEAGVTVGGKEHSRIGPGLLVLCGIGHQDSETTCRQMASKVARLRIFEDEQGKMNRSVLESGGSALVVSQFTLYADTSRGLRPSFTDACPPERAKELYELFASELGLLGVPTKTGLFGAHMRISLTNDGPVTLILEDQPQGTSEVRRSEIGDRR
jgi:D-aminoacyl-tRNA deacylase